MESANRHSTALGRRAADEPIVRLWDQLAGPISSAAMRARALRSRHNQDPQLRGELDALIVALDGVFTAILHSNADPSADATPRSESGTGWPEDGAARRFCQWVAGHSPCRSGREGWSPSGSADPAALIDELARTGQAMPAEIAALLCLPAQASYADGVERLRWARHAADGPRCRSYRSACLFLADADTDFLPEPAMTRPASGALNITPADRRPTGSLEPIRTSA